MKRIIAFLLAVMLVASIAPAAFAAEQDTTTTLTTTVPGASYVFSIPKDTEITYNALDTSIGYLEVTESAGFAVGKNLKITIEYGPFINTGNSEATIPYRLYGRDTSNLKDTSSAASHTSSTYDEYLTNGQGIIFKGLNSGEVNRLAQNPKYNGDYIGDLGIVISSSDWGKAIGGKYTSTITFTAEVVQD